MTELELLIKDINNLRNNLENLIAQRNENLLDDDVLSASKLLNAAIAEYNRIIEKKIKNND